MRTHTRNALLLALVLIATGAHAAPGFNIRWDRCYGDAGTVNKTFACDTNTGSDAFVVSFELGAEILQASGQEFTLDVRADSATLPAWWAFINAGTCRRLSLSVSTVLPPTAVTCSDWSSGASFGIGDYDIGVPQANSARLKVATAVPVESLAHLFPGTEYFSFSLAINHDKTVGTGACAGCTVPVCIVYALGKITTPVAANDVFLQPNTFFVAWQSPFALSCSRPVPTLRASWGAVKALYR